MEIALEQLLLWMPFFIKYYFVYLILGIPALWCAVRWSPERIDTSDTELITSAYASWPLLLGGVILERIAMVGKYTIDVGKRVLSLADRVCTAGLKAIAGDAEKRKRKTLAADVHSRISSLENDIGLLQLTCREEYDLSIHDELDNYEDELEEKFKALNAV